jgi:fimbrial chaperone protein
MNLICQAEKAWASNFSVNPIQVFLSPKTSRETSNKLLTLRNDSTETLRFQLSAFAWDQSPQGEIQFNPTEDVIFFPSLLSLAPGEKRNVRLGVMVPASDREKTYRIIVEELPPQENLQKSQGGTQVRVLTKLSVPIFVQPAKPVVDGTIQDMAIHNGHFSFQLKNTGNVHFVAQEVQIKGYGALDKVVFERPITGWYILANGVRAFDVEVPKADCAKIRSLTVKVQTQKKNFEQSLQTPGGACK